jgi:hypothetical protein
MSQIVQVIDPVVDIKGESVYTVLKGGQTVTYKRFPATSYSNDYATFSCPPPSSRHIIDRDVMIQMPVSVAIVGAGSGTDFLHETGRDGFRQFPIASVTEVLTANINNASVSINLADVIHPLCRYNTDIRVRNSMYSVTPSMPDQFQDYDNGYNTNRKT